MKAAPNTSVVSFHYTLRDEHDAEIESSRGGEPIAVLLGAHNVIPGVEKALEGRSSGERFDVVVAPGEGYGERQESLTQRVPKKYFKDGERLRAGEQTVLNTAHGPRAVTVLKVGQTVIDVDLNHPMAGRTLKFDLEVVEVREASDEERAHRHVHGPGGHHHD